jgi:anaphase-promoting complex subunit 1
MDLLIVKPGNDLAILTHGLRELRVEFTGKMFISDPDGSAMDVDTTWDDGLSDSRSALDGIVSLQDAAWSSVTLRFQDGSMLRTSINLLPQEPLTCQVLLILAVTLPSDYFFALHELFLAVWSSRGLHTHEGVEFKSLSDSLYSIFDLEHVSISTPVPARHYSWESLSRSRSFNHFCNDVALEALKTPPRPTPPRFPQHPRKAHKLLAPVLCSLHTLGEDLRLMTHQYQSLLRLAPVICRIAAVVRPEWADYWKRIYPDAIFGWPSPSGR